MWLVLVGVGGVGWEVHCILHLQVVIEELDGSSRDSPQGALARSTRSKVFVGERGEGKGGRQAGQVRWCMQSTLLLLVHSKMQSKSKSLVHTTHTTQKQKHKRKKK